LLAVNLRVVSEAPLDEGAFCFVLFSGASDTTI
jgi:hypothetical protein